VQSIRDFNRLTAIVRIQAKKEPSLRAFEERLSRSAGKFLQQEGDLKRPASLVSSTLSRSLVFALRQFQVDCRTQA
jgi:hypothetical protein